MKITLEERKELHRLCFSDTNEYIDGFFENIYDGKNSVDYPVSETLGGTLYFKKYDYCFNQKDISARFVSGLCVHPDFRNRGIATFLLQKLLSTAQEGLIVLHPFNVKFYQKQGFVPFSYGSKIIGNSDKSRFVLADVPTDQQVMLALFINKYLCSQEGFAYRKHTPESLLKELSVELRDGATFKVLVENAKPIGFALLNETEVLYCETIPDLQLEDCRALQNKTVTQPFTSDIFNMARVANATTLLRRLKYHTKTENACRLCFNLVDTIVAENNGSYCVAIQNGEALGVIRASNNSAYPTITAEELTLLACGQPQNATEVSPAIAQFFPNFDVFDLLEY